MSESFFAVTAPGLEPLTAQELTSIGAQNPQVHRGGVSFEGELPLLYQANLELRTATRVLRALREFSAAHSRMLYDQTRRVPWEKWIKPGQTFLVDAVFHGRQLLEGQKGELRNSHFAALKIKDAIVDRLREETGERPNIDPERPDYLIHALFFQGRCRLSLDSSGHSLHERGYRAPGAEAPLKETLAAALVDFAEWNGQCTLLDPMCGSGTILIEAARKALRIPAGQMTPRFGFQNWPDFDAKLWDTTRARASGDQTKEKAGAIIGMDIATRALEQAELQIKRAGLTSQITLKRQSVSDLKAPTPEPGILLTNPPYGERIGEKADLPLLYKTFGDRLKNEFKGWTAYILSGNPELSKHIGLKATRKYAVKNGAIDCRLLKYELY